MGLLPVVIDNEFGPIGFVAFGNGSYVRELKVWFAPLMIVDFRFCGVVAMLISNILKKLQSILLSPKSFESMVPYFKTRMSLKRFLPFYHFSISPYFHFVMFPVGLVPVRVFPLWVLTVLWPSCIPSSALCPRYSLTKIIVTQLFEPELAGSLWSFSSLMFWVPGSFSLQFHFGSFVF